MIVRANHRASVGQVSMEKSGLGCEAAEAQLEQPSLIQADSILREQEKEKAPAGLPCCLACLNVLPLVYLSYSTECLKTGWRKGSFE